MIDYDLRQMVLDYFQIEQRRNQNIMAVLADVTSKLAAMNAALDAKVTAHTAALGNLEMAVNKALADLTETGAAGHAAVLDTIVAGLGDTSTKIDSLDGADKVTALTNNIISAISAVPIPKVG